MDRTAIIAFVAAVCVLILLAVAFGAPTLPPFPFQNTQQLGPGIPGLSPYDDPHMAVCEDGRALVIFSFGTYTVAEGAHGWQVYVELAGNHLTGAYFAGGTTPKGVYFGTTNTENGHITITRTEPFDASKHHGPCEEWT